MASDSSQHRISGSNWRRVALVVVALPLFFALLLFLPAGDWTWPAGWLFLAVYASALGLSLIYVWRVNPEVIAARSNFPAGTKPWDRILLACYFPSTMVIFPVAALDAGRFHWFPVSWQVRAIGYAVLLIGIGLFAWAESVNKFFEKTVRIQTERGHRVVESGPYTIVRHPGYFAGSLMNAGIALSLGSLWALIPSGISSALLILRTQWEDQTLQAELPGYKEYAQKVRYRLIPGVW